MKQLKRGPSSPSRCMCMTWSTLKRFSIPLYLLQPKWVQRGRASFCIHFTGANNILKYNSRCHRQIKHLLLLEATFGYKSGFLLSVSHCSLSWHLSSILCFSLFCYKQMALKLIRKVLLIFTGQISKLLLPFRLCQFRFFSIGKSW